MNLSTNPLLPYREERLSCGPTFIYKEIHSVPIVAIDIWIKAGAAHDPEEYLGLSHFCEHMFFKGTERMGVGEMDRAIKGLGGYNNASTAWDYTHYYVVVPSPGWREALEVLIDALRFPFFDPAEIELERQVIYEEIKRHEDTPWSKFYEEYNALAFARCPYRRRILGTFESLARIDRTAFQEFLRLHYVPQNTTIIVVGDVPAEPVRQHIEVCFEGVVPSSTESDEVLFESVDSPQSFQLQMDVHQSYLLLGHPTPKLAGTRDEAVLDLATILLGEGRSSRLHALLKEELGLVSSVSVSLWSQAKAGLFVVEAVTDAENLPEVQDRVLAELRRLSCTPPAGEELNRIKRMALADYAFSNETVSAMAHTYGSSRLSASIEHTIRYPEIIQSVRAEELPEIVSRYLRDECLCIGHLLPQQ